MKWHLSELLLGGGQWPQDHQELQKALYYQDTHMHSDDCHVLGFFFSISFIIASILIILSFQLLLKPQPVLKIRPFDLMSQHRNCNLLSGQPEDWETSSFPTTTKPESRYKLPVCTPAQLTLFLYHPGHFPHSHVDVMNLSTVCLSAQHMVI